MRDACVWKWVIVALGLTPPTVVAGEADCALPTAEMPDKAFTALMSALASYRFDDDTPRWRQQENAKIKQNNLEALEARQR